MSPFSFFWIFCVNKKVLALLFLNELGIGSNSEWFDYFHTVRTFNFHGLIIDNKLDLIKGLIQFRKDVIRCTDCQSIIRNVGELTRAYFTSESYKHFSVFTIVLVEVNSFILFVAALNFIVQFLISMKRVLKNFLRNQRSQHFEHTDRISIRSVNYWSGGKRTACKRAYQK